MSEPTSEAYDRIDNRVTSLEELFTHFERTVSELDAVVRGLHDRMDTLDRRVESISRRLREPVDEEDIPESDASHAEPN